MTGYLWWRHDAELKRKEALYSSVEGAIEDPDDAIAYCGDKITQQKLTNSDKISAYNCLIAAYQKKGDKRKVFETTKKLLVIDNNISLYKDFAYLAEELGEKSTAKDAYTKLYNYYRVRLSVGQSSGRVDYYKQKADEL